MKKALSLILSLVLCLSLCACSGSSNPSTSSGSENSTVPPVTEHIMTDEEIFAANILIYGAKYFDTPISTKVKNVWISSLFVDKNFYFTYELEIKNQVGIVETVYYGNLLSFNDLSEETLSTATKDILLSSALTSLGNASSSMYFRENQIKAMQNGRALDAASIQEYFLKNYD